jgi:hypothetical protein
LAYLLLHHENSLIAKRTSPVAEDPLSENNIKAIANEITNYLNQHQFAADTVEGICHWWISKQRIEEEQKRVLAALDYLLQKELISKRQLPDGSLLYSSQAIQQDDEAPTH